MSNLVDLILEFGKDWNVKVTPCGHNASWSVDAFHIGDNVPNTVSGDYYILLDDEWETIYIVQRRFIEDPLYQGDGYNCQVDTLVEIEVGDDPEKAVRKAYIGLLSVMDGV